MPLKDFFTCDMSCNCGSLEKYESCCGVYHHQPTLIPSAEKLMRSRYCAYTLSLVDYLYDTTLPAERLGLSKAEILRWSQENKWMGLEITNATITTVTFKAHYLDKDLAPRIHHEKSNFKKVDGLWYYVDGVYLK